MAVLVAHLRSEARRRWPAWLAVVLLVGTVGGLVLGSLAGARRTATAYDRLVDQTEAWDVLVNPDEGTDSAVQPDAVAALPGVAAVATFDGVGAALVHDGEPTLGAGPMVLAVRDDGGLLDFSRLRFDEGAVFDPDDPTHVMVDDLVAEAYGIGAGDRVQVATGSMEALVAWEDAGAEGPPPMIPREAVVTGVGVAHDGIVEDEAFAYGHVYLSPAFAEAYDPAPFFFGMAVRLEPGATAQELRTALAAMAPDEAIELKTEEAVAGTVERGTMPHTVALLLFAAVVGSAGSVVAGQALSRQLLALRADAPTLLAMGLDRRQLRWAAAMRSGLLVLGGSAVALAVAIGLSPLFPVGVAERAEPDPGLAVDATVLGLGTAAYAGVLLVWCATAARRMGRGPAPVRPGIRPGLTERLVTTLSSPIATTGLRAAVGTRSAGRGAPAGAAMAGLSLAVAAVAATVTFGANIDRLVTTPHEYGWSWDALVTLPSDAWHTPADEIVRRFDDSPEVTGWSTLVLDQTSLDGERVPAVGMERGRGDVGLRIIDGRQPSADGEVALGGRTMDLLGVGIGDVVRAEAADGPRWLEVVGQAVFPGVGTYSGADRTELGKGVLLTRGALEDVGEGFGFEALVLDVREPTALEGAVDRALADQQAALENEEIEVHREPALPADVVSLGRVRSTPLVIGGVLALLGGAAFAVVLVAGVRARRREIAVLKTFGFRSRDVAGTVAWQATATAVVAGATGILLGTVLGRSAWSVLAEVLGVDDGAQVPVGLLAVFAGVVVVANLLAVLPGVVAARTRPATMLRAE